MAAVCYGPNFLLKYLISAESSDHNKPPPSLILKIELFAFLAIFVRYPLVKLILLDVNMFSVSHKKVLTVINLHINEFLKICVQHTT